MSRRALVDVGLRVICAVVLGAGVFGSRGLAAAQGEFVNRDRTGLAIDGYDPVAYQLERKPVKGTAEFEYTWNGTRYRFASAMNRDTFAAHPETYAPQYGGFCAYAVSRGYTATIDPEAWAVIDGKLYLNYSTRVQRTWQADATNNIKKADVNWPRLLVSQGLHRIEP